jgi:hypothetical protein
MTPEEIREQDKGRLLNELQNVCRKRPSRGSQPLGQFKLIEIAAARLGMYPSYAYRLLESPFCVTIDRKVRGMRAG